MQCLTRHDCTRVLSKIETQAHVHAKRCSKRIDGSSLIEGSMSQDTLNVHGKKGRWCRNAPDGLDFNATFKLTSCYTVRCTHTEKQARGTLLLLFVATPIGHYCTTHGGPSGVRGRKGFWW